MKLLEIANKYKEIKEFLSWFDEKMIAGEEIPIVIRNYYWELACDYFSNKKISNVLKGRQVGISVFNAGYASWLASKGKKVLFIGINNSTCTRFIELCDRFSSECSRPQINRLLFCSGGDITALSSNDRSLQGTLNDVAIFDEFAFFKDQQGVWDKVFPSVYSDGSKIITSSTPNMNEPEMMFESLCKKYGRYYLPSTKVMSKKELDKNKKHCEEYGGDFWSYNTEIEALFYSDIKGSANDYTQEAIKSCTRYE